MGGLGADEAERAVLASAVAPGGPVELDLAGEPGFPISIPVSQLAPVPRAHAAVQQALRRPPFGARVLGDTLRRDETYRWTYTAPPAGE